MGAPDGEVSRDEVETPQVDITITQNHLPSAFMKSPMMIGRPASLMVVAAAMNPLILAGAKAVAR